MKKSGGPGVLKKGRFVFQGENRLGTDNHPASILDWPLGLNLFFLMDLKIKSCWHCVNYI